MSVPVVGLLLVFCFLVSGSPAPPLALDVTEQTFQDTPVTITLVAKDADIQMFVEHPITFTILSGPQYGTLVGDLTQVVYDPELNRATVALTYTPAPRFLGTDTIVYSVTDPDGLSDVGTVRIFVLRPPVPPTWGGSFYLGLDFDGSSFSEVLNILGLRYAVNIFTFEAHSSWSLTDGWKDLSLRTRFPLLVFADITSTLSFKPSTVSFSYWLTTATFSLGGLRLTKDLYLAPSDSYAKLTARGSLNGVSFTNVLKFNLPVLAFAEVFFTTTFDGPCCGLATSVEFKFTKEGFDHLTLAVKDIALPCLFTPCLDLAMGLEVTFTPTEKTVSATFGIDPYEKRCAENGFSCLLRLDLGLVTEDATISGITLDSLTFEAALPTGMRFRAITYFAQDVTYIQRWALTGVIAPCCGGPGRWEINVAFKDDGQLFGLGQVRFYLDVALARDVRVSLDYTATSDTTWSSLLRTAVRITF